MKLEEVMLSLQFNVHCMYVRRRHIFLLVSCYPEEPAITIIVVKSTMGYEPALQSTILLCKMQRMLHAVTFLANTVSRGAWIPPS